MSNKVSPAPNGQPPNALAESGRAPSFITQVQKDVPSDAANKGVRSTIPSAPVSVPSSPNGTLANAPSNNDGTQGSRMSCIGLLCCGFREQPEKPDVERKEEHAEEASTTLALDSLLPPKSEADAAKKTLVLDLDETLVHSAFQQGHHFNFQISVVIESKTHNVYVSKRPFVDEFLAEMALHFELVIFTASLAKYADPVVDTLDPNALIKHRLFREACTGHFGSYVKDMSRLGRELRDVIILDNSPFSYLFQPENGVPVTSWFDDQNDRELLDLIPYLETLSKLPDVRAEIRQGRPIHPSGYRGSLISDSSNATQESSY